MLSSYFSRSLFLITAYYASLTRLFLTANHEMAGPFIDKQTDLPGRIIALVLQLEIRLHPCTRVFLIHPLRILLVWKKDYIKACLMFLID